MSNSDVLGRFVWHELLTTDTDDAAAFYRKVAPWRTQPSNMPGYTIFMSGNAQVAGLMALPHDDGTPAHWLMYVGTPNVDATCAHARTLGGRICKNPADIPNVGRFAVLADPQGATFAVFTPGSGAPPAKPEFGSFSWHELATTDVTGALNFYGELLGWAKGVSHQMGALGVYQLFEHDAVAVGGMWNTQGPATPPSWLSYVHVADAGRAVAAVKSAGGRLLHGPVEVPDRSWVALFLDPQGGAFAVHEMPRPVAAPAPAVKSTLMPKPAATTVPAKAARPPAARKRPATPVRASRVTRKKTTKRKVTRKKAASKVARKAARKVTRKTSRPAARKAVRKPARKKASKGKRGNRR
jgi:predicted enzyme related to lactoylglutathione lyase